jgi:hypothetical protein
MFGHLLRDVEHSGPDATSSLFIVSCSGDVSRAQAHGRVVELTGRWARQVDLDRTRPVMIFALWDRVELSPVDGSERPVNALTMQLTCFTTIEDRRLKFE